MEANNDYEELKNEAPKKLKRPSTKDLVIGLWRDNGVIKKLRKQEVVPLEIVGQQLDAVEDTIKVLGAIVGDADKTIKSMCTEVKVSRVVCIILSVATLLAGLQLWGII